MNHDQIEGRQPVREALRAQKRRVLEIQVASGIQRSDIEELLDSGLRQGAEISWTSRDILDREAKTGAHQGVIALCEPYPYEPVSQLMEAAARSESPPFLLVAAHIKDPQNLGALIRTAETAGVDGVIIPKRRAVGITPAVVKASAGATEHLSISMVTNLVRTVNQLKERRVWFYGADMNGETLYDVRLDGAIGLCVGSEGSGLPRLLKESCDGLVSIPLCGSIESLNVSAAGAVVMFEVVRRRLEC